ncbi:hypothetical protein [Pseudoruegeria sp. SK021]|uniref:hypothetical protein n=1 Tax=Pseudoruegeria sp. SK021 TaxID=1933035 RepID=UPI000A240E8C|nr:hypothetical protein [Pseudoruegeria sp. SK021]OSP56324.1 hypothetical protein BV911_03295 [Pseudoruegeria sp. SK021]
MTVLSQYQRLECAGIWRGTASDQRQNVFVALGDATLVIRDSADIALAHWSLPAVIRNNPGVRPALYTPGPEAEELLELDDDTMIEAIKTVQRAITRSRPKPGLLRRTILGLGLAAAVGLLGFWLPDALIRHTASILPEATRVDIGRRLLVNMEPVTGLPCRSVAGRNALQRLQRKVLGEAPWAVAVLRGGPVASASLPGNILLMRKSLIEPYSGPEALAGALLVEAARAETEDPIYDLMSHAGLAATFGLLTSGEISDDVLADYAQTILLRPQADPPLAEVLDQFAALGLSTEPYGEAMAPGDTFTNALMAADPRPSGSTAGLIADATWLRLQAICE